jgi:hypothetical protein
MSTFHRTFHFGEEMKFTRGYIWWVGGGWSSTAVHLSAVNLCTARALWVGALSRCRIHYFFFYSSRVFSLTHSRSLVALMNHLVLRYHSVMIMPPVTEQSSLPEVSHWPSLATGCLPVHLLYLCSCQSFRNATNFRLIFCSIFIPLRNLSENTT